MTEERGLGLRAKWLAKAITPPIIVIGTKKALVRLGLMTTRPAAAAASPEPPSEPSEWEYVPEGWDREVPGWDAGGVADAYARKWPSFLEAIAGSGPLGVYHETREDAPILREDAAAHNLVLSFAYVLTLAAHGRDRLSVLDWGGGLGHYHALARALVPDVALEWHCREVPSVAATGREVNPAVVFFADDTCLEHEYDLVLASSSLQYAVDWRERLAGLARATRGLLFVTRLPVARSSDSFVVLQRAQPYGYRTEYLGWVVSQQELLAQARTLGLVLVRELVVDGWFTAEGSPESPIGHRGFLFRPA